eukprot:212661_1
MSFFRRFKLRNTGNKLAMISGSTIGAISTMSFVNANTDYMKEYSMDDVSKHNSIDDNIWVAFQDGVYDVTGFMDQHVGGEKYIKLAAGGRLEPFWNSFNFHFKDDIGYETLQPFRIGNLKQSEQIQIGSYQTSQLEFENEPFLERPYDELVIMRMNPFLSEVKNELIGEEFFTPNEYFYTRNHFPVPIDIDINNYYLDLHIDGDANPSNFNYDEIIDNFYDMKANKSLSFQDIKNNYENIEVIATLQCGGNRGGDFREPAGLTGTLTQNAFISNAKWKGVRIRDVLIDAGYDKNKHSKYKYVTFYGYDTDLSTMRYAMSTPIDHIMNEANDCILAFEMNGNKLPRDHGYPIRVLLPGIVGCRNVKWLV